MGPKKIKKPQQTQKKEDTPPQNKIEDFKKEVKAEKQPEIVNPSVQKKENIVKPEPIQQKSAQRNPQKISLEGPKLSEQQLLRIRRQKFRTSAILNQSQKVKQQRLKKFGGSNYQTKQQLEERKKKFLSNTSITEDQAILRQRKQKFFATVVNSDPADVIEQRKKKFASNQQALVDLDQQIKKSQNQTKQIKKVHKNKFKKHDGSNRKKGERFERKKNKFGGFFQRKNHQKAGQKKGGIIQKKRKHYIKRRPIKAKSG